MLTEQERENNSHQNKTEYDIEEFMQEIRSLMREATLKHYSQECK